MSCMIRNSTSNQFTFKVKNKCTGYIGSRSTGSHSTGETIFTCKENGAQFSTKTEDGKKYEIVALGNGFTIKNN